MEMKIWDVEPGSDLWHQIRLEHCTASEAPLMMGTSTKGKRTELLDLKKTGVAKAVSDYVQRNVFDPGHAMEASARLILEEDMGEALYPVVASRIIEGVPMLASADGLTIDGLTLFEHKGWNDELAEKARTNNLDPEYYWQLEQQLAVFGAKKVLFVVSDGTKRKRVILEYRAVEGRLQKLISGWHQFLVDLDRHEVAEPEVKLVAASIENLPALTLRLSGSVSASNLAQYRDAALKFVESINQDLQTDQDFVNAKATAKFCEGAEAKIKEIKQAALSETADIKAAFDALDDLSAALRQKRLALSKLVATREQQVKDDILAKAQDDWLAHLATLDKELGPRVRLPAIICDIAGAMKGKRNISTMRDAAQTAVANAKIEANDIAAKYRINLQVLRGLPENRRSLFADAQDIVGLPAESFQNLVEQRVAKAEADEKEAERLQKERDDKLREEARLQALEDAAKSADAKPRAADQEEPKELAENQPPVVHENRHESTVSRPPRTVTRTEPVAEAQHAPQLVASLVSLESLLLAIIDGVVPEELVVPDMEAVQRYIDQNGTPPPGFRLASAQ